MGKCAAAGTKNRVTPAAQIMNEKEISGVSKSKTQLETPRMCEVLGVGVNEQWRVEDDENAVYRVNAGGMLEYRVLDAEDPAWKLSDVIHLTAVINQPTLIIRAPAWTENELIVLRQLANIGVNWLSREAGSDVVDMWSDKPEGDAGKGYKGTMVGSVPQALFPSLYEDRVVNIPSMLDMGRQA